jgi:predicted dehydrogenase
MDPQEEALHAGASPAEPGWGRSPAGRRSTLGAGDDVEPVEVEAGAYGRFYEALAAGVRHGGPLPVDPEDALVTLEVIDAARQAASAGGPVPFPER